MDRTQFTFYESFKKAANRLKKKVDRADFYDAVSDYALYGIEPNMDQYSDAVSVALELVMPVLDSSRRKAKSGKSGGSAKQPESKSEANRKQDESNGKQGEAPSKKENEKENEKEKEIEIESECYKPPSLASKGPTLEMVQEYAKLRGCPQFAKPFFEFYDTAGWRDTENKPVYNWQQKFISWEMRERKQSPTGHKKVSFAELARQMDEEGV